MRLLGLLSTQSDKAAQMAMVGRTLNCGNVGLTVALAYSVNAPSASAEPEMYMRGTSPGSKLFSSSPTRHAPAIQPVLVATRNSALFRLPNLLHPALLNVSNESSVGAPWVAVERTLGVPTAQKEEESVAPAASVAMTARVLVAPSLKVVVVVVAVRVPPEAAPFTVSW